MTKETEQKLAGPLWMMHVLGPDDIYAAPDHATAVQWCADLNRQFDGSDVLIVGVPAIWTGTPDAHSEQLPLSVGLWGKAPSPDTGKMGGEGEDDPELPDTPLARTIYKHFCEVHRLNPDEAADATGELLDALSKGGEGEAVAWRVRHGGSVHFVVEDPSSHFLRPEDCVTALYDRPDPSATERMRAALVEARRVIEQFRDPDLLSEGVHAGLRKGTSAPDAMDLWRAISNSRSSAWGDAIEFALDPYFSMWGGDKAIAAIDDALGEA